MGLSCHVIDTAWNRKVTATYRTEDLLLGSLRVTRETRWAFVRAAAHSHASRLNAPLD